MIDEKKLIGELKKRVRTPRSTMEILRDIIPFVEAQPKVGEWIPVEERLPELTEGYECFKQSPCYLVALKWWDGDITESIGWYNENGVWSEDGRNCKVVAWMPLPAPYKEDMRGGKNE